MLCSGTKIAMSATKLPLLIFPSAIPYVGGKIFLGVNFHLAIFELQYHIFFYESRALYDFVADLSIINPQPHAKLIL
jgi:hypothetical protein